MNPCFCQDQFLYQLKEEERVSEDPKLEPAKNQEQNRAEMIWDQTDLPDLPTAAACLVGGFFSPLEDLVARAGGDDD